jgi:hypothetical protein
MDFSLSKQVRATMSAAKLQHFIAGLGIPDDQKDELLTHYLDMCLTTPHFCTEHAATKSAFEALKTAMEAVADRISEGRDERKESIRDVWEAIEKLREEGKAREKTLNRIEVAVVTNEGKLNTQIATINGRLLVVMSAVSFIVSVLVKIGFSLGEHFLGK